MTEINRPKINLNALKGNKLNTIKKPENQKEDTSISENTSTSVTENISITKSIENSETTNNLTKSIIQEGLIKKQEKILKSEKTDKNIQNKEENKQQINKNGEIFSGYTSDFTEKKEKALKEAKKFKLPDSPIKVFFALFTSLLILSSLALIIIFKTDKPITNKLKINILELIGKKEKINKIDPKKTIILKETWTKETKNIYGFKIKYEISNLLKYKIDGQILTDKKKFNTYIKNKIEKLKLEKLKEHLKETN